MCCPCSPCCVPQVEVPLGCLYMESSWGQGPTKRSLRRPVLTQHLTMHVARGQKAVCAKCSLWVQNSLCPITIVHVCAAHVLLSVTRGQRCIWCTVKYSLVLCHRKVGGAVGVETFQCARVFRLFPAVFFISLPMFGACLWSRDNLDTVCPNSSVPCPQFHLLGRFPWW